MYINIFKHLRGQQAETDSKRAFTLVALITLVAGNMLNVHPGYLTTSTLFI